MIMTHPILFWISAGASGAVIIWLFIWGLGIMLGFFRPRQKYGYATTSEGQALIRRINMATKYETLAQALVEEGCLGRAKEDEPVFVLRAQDKLAPMLVHLWAKLAAMHGCEAPKVMEAYSIASEMESWADANSSKFPD